MHTCMLSRFSHVWLLATPWTRAYQAPPSMGFSRQEYWSGVPLPSPIFLYWSIIDTQCCISFCYTAKSVSYIYLQIHSFLDSITTQVIAEYRMDSLCSVCTHAQSLQSCLIFCDSTDCSLPGSFAHGTLQARILEMIARPSSKGSSPPRDWTSVSCVSWIVKWVLYH